MSRYASCAVSAASLRLTRFLVILSALSRSATDMILVIITVFEFLSGIILILIVKNPGKPLNSKLTFCGELDSLWRNTLICSMFAYIVASVVSICGILMLFDLVRWYTLYVFRENDGTSVSIGDSWCLYPYDMSTWIFVFLQTCLEYS